MKNAKGKLVIIGGHEDKGSYEQTEEASLPKKNIFMEEGVLKRILMEMKGQNSRIEVITTASMIPEEVGQMYLDAFSLLNFSNVGIMHIKEESDAANPEFLQRLRETNGIMFSGGDQRRLSSIFNGSEAIRIIQERYRDEDDFVIAGTSAGAMCLSQVMITGNIESAPLVKGLVQTGTGLGFIQLLIIDTHFVVRRRFPRLVEAVASFPDHIGLGLGEDTALLITANTKIESIGSGLVVIVDGRELQRNNYDEIINGEHLSLRRLIMHILPKGETFELQENVLY